MIKDINVALMKGTDLVFRRVWTTYSRLIKSSILVKVRNHGTQKRIPTTAKSRFIGGIARVQS